MNDQIVKEFQDIFLMEGSDCTWKGYNAPYEMLDFLKYALEKKDTEWKKLIAECWAERFGRRIVKLKNYENPHTTTMQRMRLLTSKEAWKSALRLSEMR